MKSEIEIIGWWKSKGLKLSELNVRELSEKCNIVPVIGSGMSAEYGYPTWIDFIDSIGKDVGLSIDKNESGYDDFQKFINDFNEITNNALEFEIEKRFSSVVIRDYVEQTAIDKDNIYIYYLFKMGINEFITTNYDCTIELLYKLITGTKLDVVFISKKTTIVDNNSTFHPYVFKLHGSIGENGSLRVMKNTDYSKLYENKDIVEKIKTLLKKKTLLFLGWGFPNDPLHKILEEEIPSIKGCSNYAIVPYFNDENKRIELNKKLKKMRISPIFYPEGKYNYIKSILKLLSNAVQYNKYIFLKKYIVNHENDRDWLIDQSRATNDYAYFVYTNNQGSSLFNILVNFDVPSSNLKLFSNLIRNVIENKKSILVKGRQGTGKSTVLSLIYYTLVEKGKNVEYFKLCEDYNDVINKLRGINNEINKSVKYIFIDGITQNHDNYADIVRCINGSFCNNVVLICSLNVLDLTLCENKNVAKIDEAKFDTYSTSELSIRRYEKCEDLIKIITQSLSLEINQNKYKDIINAARTLCYDHIPISTLFDIIKLVEDDDCVISKELISKYYHRVKTNKNIKDFLYVSVQVVNKLTINNALIIEPHDRHLHNTAIKYLLFAEGYLQKLYQGECELLSYMLPPDYNKAIINYGGVNNRFLFISKKLCSMYPNLSFEQKIQFIFLLGRLATEDFEKEFMKEKFDSICQLIKKDNVKNKDEELIIFRTLGLALISAGLNDCFKVFFESIVNNQRLIEINLKFYSLYYKIEAPKIINVNDIVRMKIDLEESEARISHLLSSISRYLESASDNSKTTSAGLNANLHSFINVVTLNSFYDIIIKNNSTQRIKIEKQLYSLYEKIIANFESYHICFQNYLRTIIKKHKALKELVNKI